MGSMRYRIAKHANSRVSCMISGSSLRRVGKPMSQAFIVAIKDHCPNAVLVLDHFLITKSLRTPVDNFRKEEWRKADKSEKSSFRGLRWLLFLH